MRKSDLELLEMRLEPLQAARDRLTTDLGTVTRAVAELSERVKDMERNTEAHGLSIDQGLASIRSLLQRANRAAREQGIIDDDDEAPPVDNPAPAVNNRPTRDDVIRGARARFQGRSIL